MVNQTLLHCRHFSTHALQKNASKYIIMFIFIQAVRHLDSTLNGGSNAGGRKNEVNVDDDDSVDITMEERPLRRITRARESSFSIDSGNLSGASLGISISGCKIPKTVGNFNRWVQSPFLTKINGSNLNFFKIVGCNCTH